MLGPYDSHVQVFRVAACKGAHNNNMDIFGKLFLSDIRCNIALYSLGKCTCAQFQSANPLDCVGVLIAELAATTWS